jgi:IclR family KDG regulon transcriptional repressor
MTKNDTVQMVSRAFKILEVLSVNPWQGVSELARSLSCQKSTVFRLLNTLKKDGFIIQDKGTEKYSLSLKLFSLGANTVNNLDLTQAAQPMITRLSQASKETIHLCTIDNDQIVYLQKIESPHSLQVIMMSRIGQSTPFYCTGVGKALLAYQSEEKILHYLHHTTLKRFTYRTITDKDALLTELEAVCRSGYAYDNEEHEIGVRCVAAPIFNQAGTIIAALSVSGPTVRIYDGKLTEIRELVTQAAQDISAKMGYSKKRV